MVKDYSAYGPAYRGFKVNDAFFVPEPVAAFSGENPFTRMAPIRGKNKDIHFDETYPYLDKSLKFKFLHTLVYLIVWLVGFPLNRIRFGLKIEGREKIRKNRKLFAGGVMTVCNHVHRWDMVCVLQAMRYRMAWIPMYAEPFNGKDGFKMKYAAKLRGVTVPPNMTAYLSITSEMLMFGTAVNHLMHDIEDTAVLMPFDAIYHEKKQRHIGTYLRFFHAKKRRKSAPAPPETEDEMINNWLTQRNRKVKRLLKKIGRKL